MSDVRTIRFYRRKLPHWEVINGRYFVTMTLEGAVPDHVARYIRRMREKLDHMNPSDRVRNRRRIFRLMEAWLHRKPRIDYLTRSEIASMVMEAIRFRQKRGDWNVEEYALMPNHGHLFVTPRHGELTRVLHGFRQWTGHQACKILGLENHPFWGADWFDCWSRSPTDDRRIIEYIRQNPVKGGLATNYRDYPYGSWADPLLIRKKPD